jgi:hypothetical protein
MTGSQTRDSWPAPGVSVPDLPTSRTRSADRRSTLRRLQERFLMTRLATSMAAPTGHTSTA